VVVHEKDAHFVGVCLVFFTQIGDARRAGPWFRLIVPRFGDRPRVGIATEPVMLGDLLTRLLARAGVDEVVDLLKGAPDDLDFDAVVTTIALPDTVHAGLVLELPGTDDNRGPARLRWGGQEEVVEVDSLTVLLRLLDERVPGDRPRAS
jgi:hypothetical protein